MGSRSVGPFPAPRFGRLGVVLDEMAAIAGDSVRVTVTVSADEATLPHNVKKYL